jgi:two-component system osmolarity sensor histidine kinase EnvZ
MTIAKFRFKKFIPRSLYGRFLLIVILSAVIIQLVSIYVFYYTHLDVISKHMARSVIAEMVFVKTSINKPGYENLLRELTINTGLEFSFQEKRKLKRKKIGDSDWRNSKFYEFINPIIDPYNRFKSELQSHGLKPYEIFENPENDDLIIVKVQTSQGVLTFDVQVKKITSSSAYVFIFWMGLTIVLTSFLSISFFRNQLRLIRKLSESAEKFGRGQDAPNLRPVGSQEIRSLTISFIKMKERVLRQISQRTDMLSAVSHDLRTPLTRMKLQLEMMPDSPEIVDLKSDVSDMEKLINEYLDFARFDDKEKTKSVNIKEFLQEKIINYYGKMNRIITNKIDLDGNFVLELRKLAFKRAIINLVDNAFNYGKKVMLTANINKDNLLIVVEDDGPGIPEIERENVFKPFYRIDNSRNLDSKSSSGGSGLGMAIAFDAIVAHGGSIKLSDSKDLKGLRVEISIPL